MRGRNRPAVLTWLIVMSTCAICPAEPRPIVNDSLGGTLARDHQSRTMYFQGKHRRTYLAYMDHDFNARITFYDHDTGAWVQLVLVDDCIAEVGWCKGLKDGHNVPNLWVSKSGVIHLIYGSHGRPVVRQNDLGVHLQDLNRVMNYSGGGPFLIISEATGQLPEDFKVTPANHYDNPWRKNKRLYALDEQGRFLSGPGE